MSATRRCWSGCAATGWYPSIQGDVRAGIVPEAARFGEVVAVAVPLRAIRDLPPEPFAGKLVVDANNYWPQRDEHMSRVVC